MENLQNLPNVENLENSQNYDNLQNYGKFSKIISETSDLVKQNLFYKEKLEKATKEMENYRAEINKSMFEVDLYKNQVDRLTNLTQSQEKVLSFVSAAR